MSERLNKYLAEKLRADGYGGLCGYHCGCSLGDLMVCGSPSPIWCGPGYRHECEGCPRKAEDNCPVDDGPIGTYCVGPDREYPEAVGYA